PWWFTTEVFDHAIDAVEQTGDGAVVRVVRRGEAPAPTIVVGWTAAGDSIVSTFPADHWVTGADTASVLLPSPTPIVRVMLDPSRLYPDIDIDNDIWLFNPLPGDLSTGSLLAFPGGVHDAPPPRSPVEMVSWN